jgi:hypothetical protein
VPSQKLVVIRQGNSAGGFNLAASAFDNVLWDYINKLNCTSASLAEENFNNSFMLYPNPSNGKLFVSKEHASTIRSIVAINLLGEQSNLHFNSTEIDVSTLSHGIYTFAITFDNGQQCFKKLCLN